MAAGRVFTACVFVVAPLGSKTMAATAALLHTQWGGRPYLARMPTHECTRNANGANGAEKLQKPKQTKDSCRAQAAGSWHRDKKHHSQSCQSVFFLPSLLMFGTPPHTHTPPTSTVASSVARSAVWISCPLVRVDLFCMQITWISWNKNPYFQWNNVFIPKSYQTDSRSARTHMDFKSTVYGLARAYFEFWYWARFYWPLGWFCHTDLATLVASHINLAATSHRSCLDTRRRPDGNASNWGDGSKGVYGIIFLKKAFISYCSQVVGEFPLSFL